jgi:hypothetical protein
MKNIILIASLSVILLSRCKTDKPGYIDLEYKPGQVELFAPGIVSTNLYERDIAISTGGDEIIYTSGDYKQSRRCLVCIRKTGNEWGKKEILSFSGQYNDIEPCFSVDGDKLYFASDRPIEKASKKSDYNIWVSERIKNGWSDPEPLQPTINTDKDEFFPSISRNNNLYFTSVRANGIGNEDILLSRYVDGEYSVPVPLDTNINSSAYEFNAYVSPNEDLIIFSSYGRKDDLGGGDLYYSKKYKSGNWTKSVNMGPLINSDKLDYCPFVDIPRGNFYFTSERILPTEKRITDISELERLANNVLNGMGNIYRINIDKIIKE